MTETRHQLTCDGKGCLATTPWRTCIPACRDDARALGWRRVRDLTRTWGRIDLCPFCLKKYREARAAARAEARRLARV